VRCAGVQVDLLMRDEKGCLSIIEVKTDGPLAHLSGAQYRRLCRVHMVLSEIEPAQLFVAFVERSGNVRLVPVDGLTQV